MWEVPTSATSRVFPLFLQDVSNTSGAGKTGLTASTVSVFYHRDKSATTSGTSLVVGSIGTWVSSGFTELGGGLYQYGAPDAAFASGASQVVFLVTGTNIPPTPLAVAILAATGDSLSTFNISTDSVGLKAVTHSQATVGGIVNWSNLSGTKSDLTVQINNAIGDVSSRFTVAVSTGTVHGVTNAVLPRDGVYSAVSLRLDANAVPAGAFQADSIDAVALAAMNLSDITVRVQPMAYSGMTVGISDAVGDMSSKFTVGVGKMAAGTYSGVTISGLQSAVSADVQFLLGSAALASRLASHLSSVVTGRAVAGTLSTTTMTADVAEATNDHFNGRVIVWTSGVLLGQATSINTSSGYVGFSATSSRFHFPALTEAPGAADDFIIV